MKRREFIRNGICLGCAGALGANFALSNEYYIPTKKDLKRFMCHSVDELPTKVKLDICNLCQLDCVECWARKYEDIIIKQNGGFGYVNFKTYKNFVDRHPFIKEIELSDNGEIFLNPDLNKIIKYSYEKNIKLLANNGVNLNTISEETAEYLVKYQLQEMTVSIDGATPEIYAIYRVGGDLNKVIENVKMINRFKKQYNSKFPKLYYKFIVFGHNEHEIEDAKVLAKELDMEMMFTLNLVPEYSPIKDKERVKELTGLDEEKNAFGNLWQLYEKHHNWFFCTDIFKNPQINWNGDLLGCCAVILENFHVNVFKEGLLKAMNSEKILYTKQMLADLSTYPREDSPCSGCVIYRFLKKNNYTIDI